MDGSIGAYEAKTHLSALLDRVERGETLTITRNGKPVARLVPAVVRPDPAVVNQVIDEMRRQREELQAQGISATREEIREWINEGRR